MPSSENFLPSDHAVEQIRTLPIFARDVSSFANQSPEEIAWWTRTHVPPCTLNIADANPAERARFTAANELLRQQGEREIVLFDDHQRVAEVTRLITSEVITSAQEVFRAFIGRVFAEEQGPANAAVGEWNKFAGPANTRFEDMHYWGNIGLRQPDDKMRQAVRNEVLQVAEEVWERFAVNVLPYLTPSTAITDRQEIVRTLVLGMLSNMVRGLFYAASNPSQVQTYQLRALAVDTVTNAGKLNPQIAAAGLRGS